VIGLKVNLIASYCCQCCKSCSGDFTV